MDFIQGTALILLGDILQAEAEPRNPHFKPEHPLNKISSSLSALRVFRMESETKQILKYPWWYLDYLKPDSLRKPYAETNNKFTTFTL